MKSFWQLNKLQWKPFLKRLYRRVGEDRVTSQAAQLAFYFLLSIFPLLLALMALIGLFARSDAVLLGSIEKYLVRVTPESVSGLLVSTVRETAGASNAGKVSFGLVATFWAAANGVVAMIEALNIIYRVPEARAWWKRRLVALGLTVGFMGLITTALVLFLYGPALTGWLSEQIGFGGLFQAGAQVLGMFLVLGCVVMAFNVLYVYAPNVKRHRWHWLMPGTLAAVVLWLVVSLGFKIYLGYFDNYSVTYGSLGAVIVLLMWFYFTGIAILVGAEVNCLIETECGKKPEPKEAQQQESSGAVEFEGGDGGRRKLPRAIG